MAKLTKTQSGKWKARVYIGQTSDGKKKYKQFTHQDKQILKAMANEFEASHKNLVDSGTFSVCLERYITQREGILSPSTIRGYKSIQSVLTERYASFCALSLYSISRNDIQTVINDLSELGKTGKYIKNIHGLIVGVFKDNDCPMPNVTLPAAKAKTTYEPSKDAIHATLKAARGTEMEIPILLGIHGLRRSEICALVYPDDFKKNVVHVHNATVYGYKNEAVSKGTKTDMSDRYVPLSRECYLKIKKKGYVTKKTPAAITQAFTKLLIRHGIPKYRFHDLRHFFASYLHEQGFSDAQIMKMGGWKTDAVMKNIYRYALPDETLATKINSVMSGI